MKKEKNEIDKSRAENLVEPIERARSRTDQESDVATAECLVKPGKRQ